MADILIRGMEMPDGCHNCRFSYFDKGETNDGEPCTVLMCSAMNQGTNGAEYDGNRPFWCPLVPLPEGHGRIGDLTEIEKKLQKTLDGMGDRWLSSPSMMAQRVAIVSDLKKVKEAPTIIPAEGGAAQ